MSNSSIFVIKHKEESVLGKLVAIEDFVERHINMIENQQKDKKEIVDMCKTAIWERMCDDIENLKRYIPKDKEALVLNTGVECGGKEYFGFIVSKRDKIKFVTVKESHTRKKGWCSKDFMFRIEKQSPFLCARYDEKAQHPKDYDRFGIVIREMNSLTNKVLINWDECFENIKKNLEEEIKERINEKIKKAINEHNELNHEYEKWTNTVVK